MHLIRIVLAAFLLMLVAACATLPQRDKIPLVQTDTYAEEFVVNPQGLRLFVRTWQPAEAAKGNLIILHGTALHGGVYSQVAERLAATGYRVVALDMQSWGRSEGKGDSGYVESFDDYANDVFLMTNTLRARYPRVPTYLMGESLGGAVAMYSALRRQELFDGVITSAVGYKPSLKLMGVRAPGFINSMTLSVAQWGSGLFPTLPALDADLGLRMTVEDKVVEAQLTADPYVARGFLPGAYISTTLAASDYIDANKHFFEKPLLLLHGTDDILVPLSSSEELLNSVASSQKQLKVYNSPHTVLLERAAVDAVSDVIEFLERADSQWIASHPTSH
jgi:alpha-beta hydrolase superfamily lysophospholipase